MPTTRVPSPDSWIMVNPATPQVEPNSAGKIRILLQSATHLVPGNDRGEKLTFIRNVVCQHYWKRDFDFAQERMFVYGNNSDLKNGKCFFLIDHHGLDHTVGEEKWPVVWYEWTGDSLVPINKDVSSKIQKELKRWPLTTEGKKFHKVWVPKGPKVKFDPVAYREILASSLRHGIPISQADIDYLEEYPGHAKWFKKHLQRASWVPIDPASTFLTEQD